MIRILKVGFIIVVDGRWKMEEIIFINIRGCYENRKIFYVFRLGYDYKKHFIKVQTNLVSELSFLGRGKMEEGI